MQYMGAYMGVGACPGHYSTKLLHIYDCIIHVCIIPWCIYSHQKNLHHHHIQESGTLISWSGCSLPLLSPAMSAGSVARLVTYPKTVLWLSRREPGGKDTRRWVSLLFSSLLFSSLFLTLSLSLSLSLHLVLQISCTMQLHYILCSEVLILLVFFWYIFLLNICHKINNFCR